MRMHAAAHHGHRRDAGFLERHMVATGKIAEHIDLVGESRQFPNPLAQALL